MLAENTKNTEQNIINFEDLIDDENASNFYEKTSTEAEEILHDEDKMERFLQKLEHKLKTVPIAGNALSYIPVMMSLVKSYVKKEYTDPPIASMISIVVSLIYFLSPIDLIPDTIPGAGLLDDAAVIAGCIALVRTDLEDYRIWRKDNGVEFDDIPDYEDIAQEAKKNSKFAEAFFKKR